MTSRRENRPAGRWVSFRSKGFARYWASVLAAQFAVQIQTVAVGWQVYDITGDPFALGLVGLSQFLPALLLVLVTGAVADRYSRRIIMSACLAAEAGCAAALLVFTLAGADRAYVVMAILVALGTARAFYNPARQSIVPNLVPPEHLGNAITTNAISFQFATIAGPVAGGLLYGLAPELAYATACALLLIAAALMGSIPALPQRIAVAGRGAHALLAGVRYILATKVVLGAVTLDLFAVLLGGAVALLPVYARDILEVGPWGLGLLRAGPGIGAVLVGLYLMTHPIRHAAGPVMFAAMAVFGLATLVFGLSEAVWLSVAALVVMGSADMVSVYVRSTLIQLWTPDQVRGRVNAVNQTVIGASNELGAFRAGSMAALVGAVPAVVIGGIGTLAVTALALKLFPELRRVRTLAPPAAA